MFKSQVVHLRVGVAISLDIEADSTLFKLMLPTLITGLFILLVGEFVTFYCTVGCWAAPFTDYFRFYPASFIMCKLERE